MYNNCVNTSVGMMAASSGEMREADGAVEVVSCWLHPDALYDAPYEQVAMSLDGYRPVLRETPAMTQDGTSVALQFGAKTLRISVPEKGCLRLRLTDSESDAAASLTERLGLVQLNEGGEAIVAEQCGACIVIKTEEFVLTMDGVGDIRVTDASGGLVWQTTKQGVRQPVGSDAFFCESVIQPGERFFGFGGRIVSPDRTGASVDVFSVKAGLRSGDYGGFPIPFFISTRGYGLFVNNPWPHLYFDMGRTRRDRWFMHAPGGGFDVVLLAGPHFSDVIRRYTAMTGRVPAVPRWLLGFWCSSLEFRSAEQAIADARRLRTEGYPADVFVFDGPWRGGKDFAAFYQATQQYPTNDMEWHADFGDGPAMIRELENLHVHTVLHLNSRNYAPETVKQGLAAGLLRQHGQEVVVRVLHPAAERYHASMVSPRVREGVAMWWTDHTDRVSGELAPGIPSRNLFGSLWNRLLTEIMSEHGRQGHLSLSRGGGIGSQRYAIPWPGDTRCGVDALAEDIWFMLGAGLAGFALTSVDLGGFAPRKNPKTDYPSEAAVHAEMFDDENICRRVCHCLIFTPVPRIHNNWATPPKLPWNCSSKAQRLYRQALQARYRLTPYFYSYVLQSSLTGEPLLRPLAYAHSDDAQAVAASTEFYLGDWLLVAPVTETGRETWKAYLPCGQWTNHWTDEVYHGPTEVTVAAPLRELQGLPIFVRAGAILPRQAVTDYLVNSPPTALELDVYPADGESELVLRESPTDVSRFACSPHADGFLLTLENSLKIPREYTVLLPVAGVVSAQVDGAATALDAVTTPYGLKRLAVTVTVAPGATCLIEVRTA